MQADALSLGAGVPEYFDCEFSVYDCMVFSDQEQFNKSAVLETRNSPIRRQATDEL